MANRIGSLVSRARWHLFRSPAAPAIKSVYRALERDELAHRRALAQALPENPAGRTAAAELVQHGHVSLDRLIPAARRIGLVEAGRELLWQVNDARAEQAVSHKAFWTRLLDVERARGPLQADNPFVAFATQPEVLGFVSEALGGEVPILDDVLVTLSEPTTSDLSYSQLWHRDHDDPRTLKLFVYLTNVASGGDGPFTFLPASASDRIGNGLRSHRRDEVILPQAQEGAVIEVCGIAGSAFAVETSRCLHMGSRVAPGHSRLLYTASYIPVPRLYPPPPPRFSTAGVKDPAVIALLTEV